MDFPIYNDTIRMEWSIIYFKGSQVKNANNGRSGLEVIKLEYSLRLKIKRNDWLLADMCPQAANHCALF